MHNIGFDFYSSDSYPIESMDRIVLIIGAGSNVGQSVANTFKARGYKVALASRTQDYGATTSTELRIPTDCANLDDVVGAFDKVKAAWGVPEIVVYNGLSLQLHLRQAATKSMKHTFTLRITPKTSLKCHCMTLRDTAL